MEVKETNVLGGVEAMMIAKGGNGDRLVVKRGVGVVMVWRMDLLFVESHGVGGGRRWI